VEERGHILMRGINGVDQAVVEAGVYATLVSTKLGNAHALPTALDPLGKVQSLARLGPCGRKHSLQDVITSRLATGRRR